MHGPFAGSRLSGTQIPRVGNSASTTTARRPALAVCPRCQAALDRRTGAGYCLRCGYCRSVEGNAATQAAAQPLPVAADVPRPTTFWQALGQLPQSFWLIFLATLGLLPLCYFADHQLGAGTSRVRLIWTFSQVGAGALAIYAAQVWALVLLRARREKVGFTDTIFPSQLWRFTFHHLPETGSPLCLCGFGIVTILTAIFWIGHWGWLFVIDTEPDVVRTTHVTEENSDFRQDYKKLKEAATNLKADTPAKTAPKQPPGDTRPVAQCVVIGYVLDKDGHVSALVLATLRDGKVTYAGTVTSGIGKEQGAGLLKKLTPLASNTPLLSDVDVKAATWVRPELFCEVHQSGANPKGLLIEPRFKALIED